MKPMVIGHRVSLGALVLTVACAPCSQEERDRFAGLSLATQQKEFRDASPANSFSTGRATQKLECVLSSVRGDQLSQFKFDLEYDGDYKDMVEYLFHDIDSLGRQNRLTEKLLEAPARGGIKVLTDVDDTMYANLIDKRYPKKTPYPGVLAFYDALKSEPAEIAAGLVRNGVTLVPVTTLSARPNPIAGHLENASINSLIKLTAPTASRSERRQLKPSALSGVTISSTLGTIESWWRTIVPGQQPAKDENTQERLKPEEEPLDLLHDGLTWLAARGATRHEQEDKIGKVKAKNFAQFARAYPEYRYVFVGDSGQADALTARLLLTDTPEPARSRVVTTFIHELRTPDHVSLRTSHAFDDVPANLLVNENSASGRGVIVFRNYIRAAVLAYKHRATLGDLMTADELANVTEAALVQFKEQAEEIKEGPRGRLRQQYVEDAVEAERLLIVASSDRAVTIRRLLDTDF
jgi:hypothetical protein